MGLLRAIHRGVRPDLRPTIRRQRHLSVFAGASLAGGDLAERGAIPLDVDALLVGDAAAQRAITFARSAPAVTSALVGTRSPEHVAENHAAGTFDAVFE